MRHYKEFACWTLMGLFLLSWTGCKDKNRIVEPKEGPAHLVIPKNDWYYGSVKPGRGTIEQDILMMNDGSEDLVINEVEHFCTCTRAEYNDRPIRPGHGAKLKVFLNTSDLTAGEFIRTVVVHSNGGDVSIDLRGVRKN